MKTFAEKLADLIADEFMFPGNPDAAVNGVISALEVQLAAVKEKHKADLAEREAFRRGLKCGITSRDILQ